MDGLYLCKEARKVSERSVLNQILLGTGCAILWQSLLFSKIYNFSQCVRDTETVLQWEGLLQSWFCNFCCGGPSSFLQNRKILEGRRVSRVLPPEVLGAPAVLRLGCCRHWRPSAAGNTKCCKRMACFTRGVGGAGDESVKISFSRPRWVSQALHPEASLFRCREVRSGWLSNWCFHSYGFPCNTTVGTDCQAFVLSAR